MRLADFIDQSMKLDDPGALFGSYLSALAEFGVDQVIYSPVRNTPYSDSVFPGLSHCYPEDWLSYYVEHEYARLDPVLQHGVGARSAFTWKNMVEVSDLSQEQAVLMQQSEEAGLKDGIAVPLHGPLGELYGIGMASRENNPDISQHLKAIQILSMNFHHCYATLHDESRSASGVSLTQRETEVLTWIAVGKSNWAIGEILGISEHGVDFHVRNILRKLDSDTRITAVVKALHAGMLSL